jgi:hypothetical protein
MNGSGSLALFTLEGILPIWHSLRWSSTKSFTGCGAVSLLLDTTGFSALEDETFGGVTTELLERWLLELEDSSPALIGVELEEPATGPTSPLEELPVATESLELFGDSAPAELELAPSSTELELKPPSSGTLLLELQAFSKHSFVVHCAAEDKLSSPHAHKPKATTAIGTR